jgi:hypothetical protein
MAGVGDDDNGGSDGEEMVWRAAAGEDLAPLPGDMRPKAIAELAKRSLSVYRRKWRICKTRCRTRKKLLHKKTITRVNV